MSKRTVIILLTILPIMLTFASIQSFGLVNNNYDQHILAGERSSIFMSAAIAFAAAVIGAGIAIAMAGSAAISAMAERPELKVWGLIITGLAEALAIYGFVIAFMMISQATP